MDETLNEGLPMDAHALENMRGKTVLVTGAGGSIGTVLCRMLAPVVGELRMVSVSESALYRVMKLLRGSQNVVGILADYGDSILMSNAVTGVDVVIHAGAHKHVTLCENNAVATIMNNVWGTQKLLNMCTVKGVRQFIQVSTDKAVKPASIMGATKRVCELLCTRRNYGGMTASVVRFGNVYGSDGSVIPLWEEQIANGGPLTITDRRCTRYFMSLTEACRLILGVSYINQSGTFCFDMGEVFRMEDVALRMIEESGKDIEIVEIGLQSGEKLEEELCYGGRLEPTKHPRIKKVIEEGKLQPSHQLIPDLVEHARRNRPAEAVSVLWSIVNQAVRLDV